MLHRYMQYEKDGRLYWIPAVKKAAVTGSDTSNYTELTPEDLSRLSKYMPEKLQDPITVPMPTADTVSNVSSTPKDKKMDKSNVVNIKGDASVNEDRTPAVTPKPPTFWDKAGAQWNAFKIGIKNPMSKVDPNGGFNHYGAAGLGIGGAAVVFMLARLFGVSPRVAAMLAAGSGLLTAYGSYRNQNGGHLSFDEGKKFITDGWNRMFPTDVPNKDNASTTTTGTTPATGTQPAT